MKRKIILFTLIFIIISIVFFLQACKESPTNESYLTNKLEKIYVLNSVPYKINFSFHRKNSDIFAFYMRLEKFSTADGNGIGYAYITTDFGKTFSLVPHKSYAIHFDNLYDSLVYFPTAGDILLSKDFKNWKSFGGGAPGTWQFRKLYSSYNDNFTFTPALVDYLAVYLSIYGMNKLDPANRFRISFDLQMIAGGIHPGGNITGISHAKGNEPAENIWTFSES